MSPLVPHHFLRHTSPGSVLFEEGQSSLFQQQEVMCRYLTLLFQQHSDLPGAKRNGLNAEENSFTHVKRAWHSISAEGTDRC